MFTIRFYIYITLKKHYLVTSRYVIKTYELTQKRENGITYDTWNHQTMIFNINNYNGTQGTVHTSRNES